jgi:hypothetical protein
MPDGGALEKLTIQAFEKPDYSDPAPAGEFKAFVNPSEITLAYEYEWDRAQGAGTTNARMTFKNAKPGDMTLTFFLDGTGTVGRSADGKPPDVQKMVEQFQTVTGYSGKLHRPYYLKVLWGTLQIKRCVLKSASIAYKLFKPDGVPLRAVVTAAFSDNADDKTRVAIAQDQSADLTHRRVVRAGDDLPRLCAEIYGDPRLYLKVARANGLDDFRALAPGSVVFFPPLEA